MKKISFIILFLAFGYVGSLFAQSDSENIVIKGDKGRFTILNSVRGAQPSYISPNGTYITGSFGPGSGYVYNTLKDTIDIYIGEGTFLYSNNEKVTVGNIHPTGVAEIYAAGTYDVKNAKWHMLPRLPSNSGDVSIYGNGSASNGISAGTTPKIAGTIYEFLPGRKEVVYSGAIWQNDTIKEVLHSFFPLSLDKEKDQGYGARPTAISEDGSTAVGFGSNTITGVQRTPHIWRNGVTHYVGVNVAENWDGGICLGTNSDGTVVTGGIDGMGGAIWRWNGSEYKIEHIAPLTGYDGLRLMSISDNEVAVGYMWTGLVVNNIPIVYSKMTGVMDLRTFFWEMYGINTSQYDLFLPAGISKDGRKMAVSGGINGTFLTLYIDLDETPINTRPLRLAAKQVKNSLNVALNWSKPYNNGKTVAGYNVYRDSVQLNSSLITELKYEVENTEVGSQTYTVSTVFEDQTESKYSDPVKLQIIEVGGCYSVKRFENEIVYNKTVKLYWGLPSSEIIDFAPTSNASLYNSSKNENSPLLYTEQGETQCKLMLAPENSSNNGSSTTATYQNQAFDYISTLNLLGANKVVLFEWKGMYYVGDYVASTINRFDLRGNFVSSFVIPNLASVSSFTTDGKNVFVACGTKFIYKVDLERASILDQYRLNSNAQRVCYIPELNNGQGGFEVGEWNTSSFVNMEGESLGTGFDFTSVFSTVYYKGKIYASQQTGKNYSEIREYNFADKTATGLIFDLMSIPNIREAYKLGGAIGGMNLVVMEDSTIALAAVMQSAYSGNSAVFLELESMPGLLGFNLYKDGIKVNETPLKSRTYSDEIVTPGKYEYYVTSLSESGCESAVSRKDTLEIYSIGICNKVDSLHVEEISGEVFLKWKLPQEGVNLGKLLGFNIYRDQDKINDEFVIYSHYQDRTPVGAEPLYKIEAFYENSCVASDSISVKIYGNGKCDVIHLLDLAITPNSANPAQYNVDLKWDLPYYEAMYPLTWGKDAAYTAVGLPANESFTVAIGFDSSQIKKFLDYKVVGIDFYLNNLADIKPIVLIDEVLMYYQEPTNRMKENAYNRIMFETAIPLNSLKAELVVGYTVSNYIGNPVGVDYAPLISGYGDLLSKTPLDMKSWQTAAPGGNWAISILLAKDRNVNTNASSEAVSVSKGKGILHEVKLNPFQSNFVSQFLAAPYENKNTIKLLGFNVYRNGSRLNTEPIQSTEYTDLTNLNAGNYKYSVGSIWSECDELISAEKNIGITASEALTDTKFISIYPNPAKDDIYIQGDFERAEVIDISGKIKDIYQSGISSFSVRHLQSGVYVLRITNKRKLQYIRFVVK